MIRLTTFHIKKGATTVTTAGEPKIIEPDEILVEVPLDFANHHITQTVPLHELADAWIRERGRMKS